MVGGGKVRRNEACTTVTIFKRNTIGEFGNCIQKRKNKMSVACEFKVSKVIEGET